MVLLDQVGPNIDRIPSPKRKKQNWLFGLFKDTFLVIFFSCCVFIFINFPAIKLLGTYKLYPKKLEYQFPSQESVKQVVAVKTDEIKESKEVKAPATNQYPDNTLFIPKIGVKAPIGWDTKNSDIMDALEKNIVHLEDSDKPGGPGNIFLTGHSSNYWWKTGDFNTVFALLPQLAEGDEIIITYKGQFNYYKVTDKQEMRKDEVADHLESGRPRLTLMTCVPVGTNLRRMLIFAEPI